MDYLGLAIVVAGAAIIFWKGGQTGWKGLDALVGVLIIMAGFGIMLLGVLIRAGRLVKQAQGARGISRSAAWFLYSVAFIVFNLSRYFDGFEPTFWTLAVLIAFFAWKKSRAK